MGIKRKVSLFAAWIALCVLVVCAAVPAKAAGEYDTVVSAAAETLREGMLARQEEITVVYTLDRLISQEEFGKMTGDIFAKTIEHTGSGTKGDYLYFHQSEWGVEASVTGNGQEYSYTLIYHCEYYTTAAQEAKLAAAVSVLLSRLNLGGKSEYDKVKAIYDYICENVKYDYDNLNDEAHILKYSAYAALCNGTSVCQGYANLFYRLANEAGLDARIVSGISRGQNHAWNIVRVDGKYYNIDSTWDAGRDAYNYFLRGSANFDGHMPGGEHPANYATYNISEADYVISTPEKPTEVPTETTTEGLTEAPTERPTEESTEAPTERPTEESTEAPTETTTEELTEAPTEVATEETTEATTEESTEAPTEATTEELTEAPTERPTKESTEVPAEASTEESTEVPAETLTEGSTETPTHKPTEELTEDPTEVPTEATISTETTTEATAEAEESTEIATEAEERATEAVSETETETPGDCGMPDDPIPTESSVADEPKEDPNGKVIYLVVGGAGVVVAGTGVMVGRVILKKRNAK